VTGAATACPLARLYDALLELCVDNNGRDTANTSVINVIIDVFNDALAGVPDNVRARRIALFESARLAHCTIDVRLCDGVVYDRR
jgi:hypothetical protein